MKLTLTPAVKTKLLEPMEIIGMGGLLLGAVKAVKVTFPLKSFNPLSVIVEILVDPETIATCVGFGVIMKS